MWLWILIRAAVAQTSESLCEDPGDRPADLLAQEKAYCARDRERIAPGRFVWDRWRCTCFDINVQYVFVDIEQDNPAREMVRIYGFLPKPDFMPRDPAMLRPGSTAAFIAALESLYSRVLPMDKPAPSLYEKAKAWSAFLVRQEGDLSYSAARGSGVYALYMGEIPPTEPKDPRGKEGQRGD